MKIYNTMSKKKEEFIPLEEGKSPASMYVDLLYTTLFTLVMQDR